jgi:kinesin family protein 18/19
MGIMQLFLHMVLLVLVKHILCLVLKKNLVFKYLLFKKTILIIILIMHLGIMFRTLHDLFIEISRHSNDLMYQVSMSYLEIYNELIRDLLSPSNGFLELREDAKGGVQVAGISELVAETPQEVMYMLHKGNKERTQEPTKANKTSSRSHAVLQVNIKQRNKVRAQSQEIRLGKLYMIDLAGSERAAQTQNTGKRMVEGAHINRSLLALGNCINALSEKGSTKYVNYRDSKLTRILKDALGGNSKTVMIAHVSPASIHFEESRNTLVYADRAKYIRTKLRRNVIDVTYHISQYQQIIQELAQEIATLKDQRSDLESRISHLDPRLSTMNQEDKNKIEEALKLRESLLQSFKNQIKLRKNILELENAVMDLNIEAERHKKIIEKYAIFKNFINLLSEFVF